MSQILTPKPIAEREFNISPKALAKMADAELSLVRTDMHYATFKYKSSLNRMLARIESFSTLCIDGTAPRFHYLLALEATDDLTPEKQASLAEIIQGQDDPAVREATIGAVRYEKLIKDLVLSVQDPQISEKNLLEWHALLRHGKDENKQIHYRQKPYKMKKGREDMLRNLYLPPQTSKLRQLMTDLIQFSNQMKFSPVTQSALAHYQLEAIRPFKHAMDRTGRTFAYAIQRKRHFCQNIIAPIALVPVMNIERHAKALFPYRTGQAVSKLGEKEAIDAWIQHCAKCISLSAHVIETYAKNIAKLEENWRGQISGCRSGSTVDILLRELPGRPLLSVSQAMACTGRGFSATNDAIVHLVEKGILEPVSQVHRNRYFEAVQATAYERKILMNIIPENIAPRESYFLQ